MTTQYARVVRWSLALTSVVAAVAVVLCAALGGSKGAYGALIGVGVVTAFFAISIIVVGRAARVNPMAMMVAALGTFLGKIIAFMIVLALLRHSTAFNGKMLGFAGGTHGWGNGGGSAIAVNRKYAFVAIEVGKHIGDEDLAAELFAEVRDVAADDGPQVDEDRGFT